MSGIGSASEVHLAKLGIHTLGQLAEQDPERMRQVFGISGPRMVLRAAGLEESHVRAVDELEGVKSVSNERTFAHDLTTRDEIEAAIDHVSALAGARLRKKGLTGSQVTLKLKFDIRHTHTAQCQLDAPTDDEHVFGLEAKRLLDGLWREGTGVRLVGVGVSNFDGAKPKQLDLFASADDERPPEEPQEQKRDLRALSVATDDIRRRFGAAAVSYGRDLRFRDDTSNTLPMDGRD
jgi:DNA polymerase-4